MRIVLGLLIGLAPFAASAAVIGDASFEDVSVAGSYEYRPTGSAWTFLGNAGLTASPGTFVADQAPGGGAQAAFIQSGGSQLGEITQTLIGLVAGTTYTFSFYAAHRDGYDANPIDASFAGVDLGTVTPTLTTFVLETTASFVAQGASGTLSFLGTTAGGDVDSAIDLVTLSAQAPDGPSVPEPATLTLLGAGLAGLGVIRRRPA